MTKDELVAMVHQRTAAPLGMKFDKSALDDFIKDGLVLKGRRDGNAGRRPIYRFNWRDLHRVTFIVAMQSRGVRRRDALRLRLFVAGCRLPDSEVRQALLQEYRRAAAALNAQLRSTQVDNQKLLTPKRMASITREIGSADTVLRDAGLEVPASKSLEILRAARQDPLAELDVLSGQSAAILARDAVTIGDLAEALGEALAGMFLMNGAVDDDPKATDSVEGLIRNADPTALFNARAYLRALTRQIAATGLGGLMPASDDPRGVRNVVRRTVTREPGFLAVCLFLALRVAGQSPEKISAEQAEFTNWLMKYPSRIRELQGAASPEDATTLVAKYFDEFNSIRDSRRQ